MTAIDLGHHQRSLADLVSGTRGTALVEALQSCFPFPVDDAAIDLEGLDWGTPTWRGIDEPTWARSLYARVRLRRPGQPPGPSHEIRLAAVPWLCDDDAARTAPDHVALPMGHDGLYVGRPLVPLAQLRHRSGVYLRRPPDHAPYAVLVPDLGRPLVLERTRDGELRARISLQDRGVDILPDGRPAESGPAADILEGLTLASDGARWRRTTLDDLDERLGIATREVTWPQRFRRVLAVLADGAVDEGSPTDLDATRVVCYGDLVFDAVLESCLIVATRRASSPRHGSNAREADDRAVLDGVLGDLRGEMTRRLRALRLGRSTDGLDPREAVGSGGLVVADDRTNTLARLERRRTVTRLGPGGLVGALGQRDLLRDTHPSYRGRLCPLQTPESQNIGLVRFLALDARIGKGRIGSAGSTFVDTGFGELSAGAGLIPYLNHNEPARTLIGSKNLKQAVPIEGAQAPLIRTGVEAELGGLGVIRAPSAGTVVSTTPLVVEHLDGSLTSIDLERAAEEPGCDSRWSVAVEPDALVARDEVLAYAPDVRLDQDGTPVLALGAELLVAYTPMGGLNFEDAIVVSEAVAERFASSHVVEIREDLDPADTVRIHAEEGLRRSIGEPLASVRGAGGADRVVVAPEDGAVVAVILEDRMLRVRLRVRRTLTSGDKLTNRHGAKGVVSRVLPVDEMPRLPDGTAVEAVLNPIGVLKRLNVGQLIEAATGLLARLGGERPSVAGRRHPDLDQLRADLARLGAPDGKLDVTMADGTTHRIVVGTQYLVKLDHLAASKLRARDVGPYSPATGQPARGSRWSGGVRIGGAQRMGEMELWALQAAGADLLLEDALVARSDAAVRTSFGAHAGPGSDMRVVSDGQRLQGDPARQALAEARGPDGSPVGPAIGPSIRLPTTFRSVAHHLRAAGIATHLLVGTGADPQRIDVATVSPDDDVPGPLRGIGHRLTRGDDPEDRIAEIDPEEIRARRPADGRDDPLTAQLEVMTSWRCWCGEEERRSRICGRCGGSSRRRWRPDSAAPVGRLIFPEPVPHPWFHSRLRGIGAEHGVEDVHGQLRSSGWSGITDELQTALTPFMLVGLPVIGPGARVGANHPLDQAYRSLAVALQALDAHMGTADAPRARAHLWMRIREVLGRPGAGALPDTIAGRLGGKQGLLRRGLLGRLTDRAARGVIVPEPELDPERVALPASIADRLELVDEDIIVLNRQPTLHPYNLLALRVRRHGGSAIGLPPLLCEAIAGDFDGDEVTIHAPVSGPAAAEAWERLRPAVHLRSAATGRHLVSMGLDVALGLVLRGDPGDAPVEGSDRAALDAVWARQREGMSGAVGWSISLLELLDLGREHSDDAGALLASVPPDSPLGQAIAAGVAGSRDRLRQLLIARGHVERLDASLEDADPITGCYRDGLDDDAFFADAPGAVRSQADKKLMSPVAGGLTKRLAEIGYDVRICPDDCRRAEPSATTSGPSDRSGPRSPLSCQADQPPCRACYGPDAATGRAPDPGAAVGLLAAMLIGQGGTQLTMRTRGEGGALTRDLDELRGLFGEGSFTLGGEDRRLQDVFEEAAGERGDMVLQALLERFVELMKGAVGPVHAAVLLRRLMDTPDGAGSLAARAERTSVPLIDATVRGNLGPLVSAFGRDGHTPERGASAASKARLMVGAPVEVGP